MAALVHLAWLDIVSPSIDLKVVGSDKKSGDWVLKTPVVGRGHHPVRPVPRLQPVPWCILAHYQGLGGGVMRADVSAAGGQGLSFHSPTHGTHRHTDTHTHRQTHMLSYGMERLDSNTPPCMYIHTKLRGWKH